MFEPCHKPVMVESVPQWRVGGDVGVAFKGMLNGDLATVVLAQEGTNNGPRL